MQDTLNKLCSRDLCTGCFACKQVCAKGAIHIKEVNGFLYPEIDDSICVDCGLCSKVCPVLNVKQDSADKKENDSVCYAIWNNNQKDRISSSSGGVFSVLANETIKDGGIVYGAAWDKDMQLRHVGVDDLDNLDILRRSKYVQSNTEEVFNEVKQQLKSEREVLFCGTSCQIAGLLSYLGHRENPNLITVGVVCHGVPSQKSFDKYINEIEEEKKVRIYDCNFRSKDKGWRTGLNLLVYAKDAKNKDVVINRITADNSYFNAFLKYYFLRESCYNCPFKGVKQVYEADIMLSDFWSLWSTIPMGKVDYGKGVSAVVSNTEKGQRFLEQCSGAMTVMERPYSEYASNSGLRRARKPKNNDAAFEYLQSHSWKETQAKFFPLSLGDKMPIYTRMLLGENKSILIKKFIKRVLHR